MTSIIARLPLPPLMLVNGRQFLYGRLQKLEMPAIKERQERLGLISKATGDSSDSSIVKSIQNVWDKSEGRVALIGLGFAGVVAFWASINLVAKYEDNLAENKKNEKLNGLRDLAIDKLPIFPSFFELVGIVFSSWFVYRYLVYKPDREELFQAINKSISDILGQ